ncbi:hypothetical protein MUK42_12545 [Musa troglodytarum]|uniref:Uncharacterized protein n=1 Tax=Musa troglodytarum TaxID=320322 RepID=A0A9E7GSG8_9LILI|nr:hypothetical protein MUK42_12545 [Musa troglodytarum]
MFNPPAAFGSRLRAVACLSPQRPLPRFFILHQYVHRDPDSPEKAALQLVSVEMEHGLNMRLDLV